MNFDSEMRSILFRELRCGKSLHEAGFPTHEDLAARGLTGRDFYLWFVFGLPLPVVQGQSQMKLGGKE